MEQGCKRQGGTRIGPFRLLILVVAVAPNNCQDRRLSTTIQIGHVCIQHCSKELHLAPQHVCGLSASGSLCIPKPVRAETGEGVE